jgi:protein-disulfide isomerase
MSKALPWGVPSAMSNRITSPSSSRAAMWARVPPIMPAPIRAILARAMGISASVELGRRGLDGAAGAGKPPLPQRQREVSPVQRRVLPGQFSMRPPNQGATG